MGFFRGHGRIEDIGAEAASPTGSGEVAEEVTHKQRFRPNSADLAWLEERLAEDELARCEAGMLSRYLRATGGDRQHALKRIRDTLEWRACERPEQLHCKACELDPSSHYMHVVGWDLQQRPIIYSCLELPTNRSVADNTEHMLACFESAIRLMPEGVESWVWVMDLFGFGLRDCDPRLAHKFFHLAGSYYPERLGHFFLVSPPAAFSTLWKGVYRFIDPVTRDKIDFLNFCPGKDNSKVEAVFARHFDPEVARWLLNEMAENRTKLVAHNKSYSYSDLKLLVEGPESEAAEAAAQQRRRVSGSGEHDHLGTPRFIRTLSQRGPAVLPPPLRPSASPPEARVSPA